MSINLKNYEEYLLSYVDRELDSGEKAALLSFLEEHPELQRELKVLESAKLPGAEGPIFPDKGSLYRKTPPTQTKVVFLHRHPWLAAASAACMLLVAGFLFFSPRRDVPSRTTAVRTAQPVISPAEVPPVEKQDSPGNKTINPRLLSEKQVLASGDTKKKERKSRVATLPVPSHPAIAPKRGESPARNTAVSAIRVLPQLHGGPVISGTASSLAPIEVPSRTRAPEPGAAVGSPEMEDAGMVGGKLAMVAQTMDDTKNEIDNTITRKLSDLHEQTSGLIDQLARKGIRIGRITFALND